MMPVQLRMTNTEVRKKIENRTTNRMSLRAILALRASVFLRASAFGIRHFTSLTHPQTGPISPRASAGGGMHSNRTFPDHGVAPHPRAWAGPSRHQTVEHHF